MRSQRAKVLTRVSETGVASAISRMSAPAAKARSPGAGDHDAATGIVGVEPLQRLDELAHRLGVEGVEHLGSVEGDERHGLDGPVRAGCRQLDADAVRRLGLGHGRSSARARASGSVVR